MHNQTKLAEFRFGMFQRENDMKRIDACELDRMIEKKYGRKFNIPTFMEGQKSMELEVTKHYEDYDELVETFAKGENDDRHGQLEALVSGLCEDGLLKKGEYLVQFDD